MSAGDDRQPTWFDAPNEAPDLELARARQVSVRHLLVRFAFGAATSAVAGTISIVWNSKTAGVMLAFPAILAASLTLIADEDGRRAASEDARGAFVGAIALGAFALVAYASFGHLGSPVVLVLALLAWLCIACGTYLALWAPRHGVFATTARRNCR
jgi:hypothetical protein